MVGNNTPIFFIRDPSKFPDFIHTQKRHPQTNLPSADMVWDFASLVPESVHQFSFLFSDRGIPANYRQMNGYSSHTFKWVNAEGAGFWIKLHYKPEAGVKSLTSEEAAAIDAKDKDHATRDLFSHIASGKTASWTVHYQIIPEDDASKFKWNIFDITKVWPHKESPLQPLGKLVLNRNPENYFSEVEQAAFSPGHLVPGIEPSPDRMLQGRLFSYPDTHRHRLGPNYLQIPINCPYAGRVAHHQRDAAGTINGNLGSAPNYEPNSWPGQPAVSSAGAIKKFRVDDFVGRYNYSHPNSDFEQVGHFWRHVLKEDEKERLVQNIAGSLSQARKHVQTKQVEVFTKADKDYGRRVAEALAQKATL